MQREGYIALKANEFERQALRNLAKKERLSMSEYLRYMIRTEAEKRGLWPKEEVKNGKEATA